LGPRKGPKIYVEGVSVEQAVEWLGTVLGPLRADDAELAIETVRIFAGSFQGRRVPVILVPDLGGSGFLGICVNAAGMPWPSDRDFARAAHQRFRRAVRCDWPREEATTATSPYEFWQVTAAGEGPVHRDA
jgi:hypothetical protein